MSEFPDEDLVITEIRTPSEASFSDFEPGELASSLYNAYRFIHDLQQAQSPEIPQDRTECPICQEDYGMNGQNKKIAKMPSCGHLFCLECICKWVKPTETRRNTCPSCRAVLFEMAPASDFEDDDDDEEDEDEEDYEGIMPELLDRLFPHPHRIEAICTGLSFIESVLHGSRPMPQGIYYSRQMWMIWRLSIHQPMNEPVDAVLMDEIRRRIAHCLGQLSVRFGTILADHDATAPWGQNGPRIEHMSDPDLQGMIEAGILEFQHAESLYA